LVAGTQTSKQHVAGEVEIHCSLDKLRDGDGLRDLRIIQEADEPKPWWGGETLGQFGETDLTSLVGEQLLFRISRVSSSGITLRCFSHLG
jgi:hypothetical protein